MKTRQLAEKFSSSLTQICCVEEISPRLSDPLLDKPLKLREKSKCKKAPFSISDNSFDKNAFQEDVHIL